MLPDTKGDTGGIARRSATVCPVIVSTINVNDIRAAIKQRSSENLGLLPWLEATTADVVCLQETRADDKLAGALAPALSNGPPRKLGVPPGIWHRRAGISRAAPYPLPILCVR